MCGQPASPGQARRSHPKPRLNGDESMNAVEQPSVEEENMAEAVYQVADLEQQAAIAKGCFFAVPALLSLGVLLSLIPGKVGGSFLSAFVGGLIAIVIFAALGALWAGASARS